MNEYIIGAPYLTGYGGGQTYWVPQTSYENHSGIPYGPAEGGGGYYSQTLPYGYSGPVYNTDFSTVGNVMDGTYTPLEQNSTGGTLDIQVPQVPKTDGEGGGSVLPFNIPLPVLQPPTNPMSNLGTNSGWNVKLPEIPKMQLPQFKGIPTGL